MRRILQCAGCLREYDALLHLPRHFRGVVALPQRGGLLIAVDVVDHFELLIIERLWRRRTSAVRVAGPSALGRPSCLNQLVHLARRRRLGKLDLQVVS